MKFTKLLGTSFPTIQTEHMRLRQLKHEDAPALYNDYSNENVYCYLDWNGPESLEKSMRLLKYGTAMKRAGLFVLPLLTTSQMK